MKNIGRGCARSNPSLNLFLYKPSQLPCPSPPLTDRGILPGTCSCATARPMWRRLNACSSRSARSPKPRTRRGGGFESSDRSSGRQVSRQLTPVCGYLNERACSSRSNLIAAAFCASAAICCAISRGVSWLTASYPQQNERYFNGPSFALHFSV